MSFFKCIESILKRNAKVDHRPRIVEEIPTPEPAPAPHNIKPKSIQPLGHIYPGNWKYVKDPDGGNKPMTSELPQGVVLHQTVTYNLNSTVAFFKRNVVDVHFVIGHDGKIVQMADCNKSCAHAGRSEWDGFKGLNQYFIGIELVNLGPLTKQSDGSYLDAYDRPFNGLIRERKAFGHKYWEACPREQEEALLKLCRWIQDRYKIPVDNFTAHYEVSPNRKIDPAGALSFKDMDEFRDELRIF